MSVKENLQNVREDLDFNWVQSYSWSLRNNAYSNILKLLLLKK